MKPRITRELQDTLEHNIKIETVYFEVATGAHHFNHVKTVAVTEFKDGKSKETGKTKLTINGKEVVPMDRDDVLLATPDESITREENDKNQRAVVSAVMEVFKNLKPEDLKGKA